MSLITTLGYLPSVTECVALLGNSATPAMSVRYMRLFESKPMFQRIAAGVFTCNYCLTDISTSTVVILL